MKPALAALLSIFFFAVSISGTSHAAINESSSKYAALVMDAENGEVLFSRNADSKRYPASLTKMMTIYLLFEAVRDGKMSFSQKMNVSQYAASQPQTNISLKKGDKISVDDAVKALVVRSANDVAVVVAEALGTSEWRFAQMMTQKAHQLGMRSTAFRNPHGLPDTQQYTTARDMARLAIALRRDFPQYYGYFSTDRFTWKGTTYKSHNRALGRIDGADGLKTGYINMSGFNLATSIKRDGYNIVGIVMGGQTGRDRDDHMVNIVDKTFVRLAARESKSPRQFAQAPIPAPKPETGMLTGNQQEVAVIGQGDAAETLSDALGESRHARAVALTFGEVEIVPQTKPEMAVEVADAPVAVEKQKLVANRKSQSPSTGNIVQAAFTAPAPGTLQYQMAMLQQRQSDGFAKIGFSEPWGIQVGAFADEQSALQAAAKAVDVARDQLKDSKVLVTDNGATRRAVHRARLANLSERQAKQACEQLVSNNQQCFVYRADMQRDL